MNLNFKTDNEKFRRKSVSFLAFSVSISAFIVFSVFHFFGTTLLSERFSIEFSAGSIFFYLLEIGFWLIGAVVLNQLLQIFFWQRIVARTLKHNVPQLLIDLVGLVIYAIAITIIIGHVFKQSLTGFWATSGVVALIVGLALRNIITDIFTGLAVNIERPYTIGDYIQVHQRSAELNIIGRVIDINWRATKIQTEENSIVVIPNSLMSMFVVTNFYEPTLQTRFDIYITLDFSVSTIRAKRVLLAAVKNALDRDGFLEYPEPQVLIDETNELGVNYRIRYWIKPWDGVSPSRSKDIVLSNVLAQLSIAGITPAYPKEDIYYEKMPVRHLDSVSEEDRIEILSRVELFAPLSKEQLSDLSVQMLQLHYKKSSILIKQGSDGESMFILVEGLLEVLLSDSDEKQIKVAQLAPGEFFGEMSLLTGEPRSATIRAVTDVVVYKIVKSHLSEKFQTHPELIEKISKIMSARQMQNRRKMESLDKEKIDEISKENAIQILSRIRTFFRGA